MLSSYQKQNEVKCASRISTTKVSAHNDCQRLNIINIRIIWSGHGFYFIINAAIDFVERTTRSFLLRWYLKSWTWTAAVRWSEDWWSCLAETTIRWPISRKYDHLKTFLNIDQWLLISYENKFRGTSLEWSDQAVVSYFFTLFGFVWCLHMWMISYKMDYNTITIYK